ncbi:AraC family transcriptional regulator [Saccharopolyspora aridisoli]|uniref:AraC family transcriptional regulator n=1 Tax=Saccharopolyspora aridisoli TaxID=2530385 RepID=A0A4R4UUU0_9PSEU|nr:helix-turn-helix domain-containing protein [Saccharopolyspora aridisoli]TDC95880.1 AraC family transcriptional regulator [Saccharopolyspora aridisoli]
MSKAGRPEAIVRPKAGARAFEVERLEPDPALAEFVDYYWLVRWTVTDPHRQQVVPQPRVHVAAEDGRLFVHGVSREPFFRTLTGVGHVLGAAFHPGGFRALLKGSVGAISGTVRTAEDVLGHDDRAAAERILSTSATAEIVPVLDAYLLACEPEPDPAGREATDLVNEAQRRSGIVRAEQLAQHAGLSLRSLQRLFADHVGIGPKWVIQRSRILDATAAAHSGEPVDWSELAAELGFSDQAHLTRAFTQVVGTSPATYRRDPGTAG